MKKFWSAQVFIFTVLWILINYVSFYTDDLMIIYGVSTNSLWIQGAQALAFPVTWYVKVIEPFTLLPIPVLGRALNYCVELTYFYSLLFCLVAAIRCLDKNFVQKLLQKK